MLAIVLASALAIALALVLAIALAIALATALAIVLAIALAIVLATAQTYFFCGNSCVTENELHVATCKIVSINNNNNNESKIENDISVGTLFLTASKQGVCRTVLIVIVE